MPGCPSAASPGEHIHRSDWKSVLDVAAPAALEHLESLPDRRVHPSAGYAEVRAALDHRLQEVGLDPAQVMTDLVRDLGPYVTAHVSGRFFGFVIGGLHPAAWGAELPVSTWDQNAALFPPAPGVAVAEELAGEWLVDLLQLPPNSSVGFVTGGQMANFTCLGAARDKVLRDVGWDVEADGLSGAPAVTILLKEGVHSTVPRAFRFLGIGERAAVRLACDDQDRLRPDALERALSSTSGPTIVVIEAGNVNTGSFDDFDAVADLADAHRAAGSPTWVHVDGAVMLLAAASPAMAKHTRGLSRLDSLSTDGHKLLNVAYDCGVALCREPAAHRAAMSVQASYLEQGTGARDAMDWNPEFSRRARGVGVYATLRALGRSGLVDLVDRTVPARATLRRCPGRQWPGGDRQRGGLEPGAGALARTRRRHGWNGGGGHGRPTPTTSTGWWRSCCGTPGSPAADAQASLRRTSRAARAGRESRRPAGSASG